MYVITETTKWKSKSVHIRAVAHTLQDGMDWVDKNHDHRPHHPNYHPTYECCPYCRTSKWEIQAEYARRGYDDDDVYHTWEVRYIKVVPPKETLSPWGFTSEQQYDSAIRNATCGNDFISNSH